MIKPLFPRFTAVARAAVLFGCLSIAAFAVEPIKLSGTLYNKTSEGPEYGTHNVKFTLYSDGGALLWSEAVTVLFDDGRYSVTLGASAANPLPEDLDIRTALLGVKVDEQDEMVPRLSLVPVYAREAGNVRGDITPRTIGIATDSGILPLVDNNGSWVGPEGPKGDPGPEGPAGSAGPAGPIGPEGPVGAAGPKGDTGAAGAQGPKGDTGAAGAQGPKGDTGRAGPKGDTGPQGVRGERGAPGLKGDKGDKGATGSIGPMGPTGPRGPQGERGIQGPKGEPGDSTLSGHFGTAVGTAADGRGTECTMGQMMLFAGTVGTGLRADGRLLDISSNTALFSLLGNRYGGDGRTTFALPDMSAVTPNGMTWFICDQGIFPSRR